MAPVSPPRTTVELLRNVAAEHPDRAAFVEVDRRLTFAEWDRAADGVAAYLAAQGVGSGRRRGAARSVVDRLRGLLSGRDAIARDHDGHQHPSRSARDREHPRTHATARRHSRRRSRRRCAPRSRIRPRADLPPAEPDDAVAIVWTSGTTGMPKGAVFDHRNLHAVAIGAGAMGAPFDVRLAPLPFAHVAFMSRPWEEIENAITTVITPTPWTAADALHLMARERVTVGQGVPTQWRLVLDHADFAASDLDELAHRGHRRGDGAARARARDGGAARMSGGDRLHEHRGRDHDRDRARRLTRGHLADRRAASG